MTKLLSFLIILMTVACSQIKTKSNESSETKKHLTPEQIQELNQKTLSAVSKRLEELSVAAKASGPDKVRFLANDMYLKASAAMMEGDFTTANIIFNHLVKLIPKDKFIKKKYAISLIRTGELTKSKEYLTQIMGKGKTFDESVALVLAGVHSSLGDIKNSQRLYRKIVTKNSKNHDACVYLSKSYSVQKKYKSAISILKNCFKKNKNEGIYPYYIGKIFVNKNDLKAARAYFRKAVSVDPDFSQATLALGLVNEEEQKFKEAIKIYKTHLKNKPNDTMILSRLVQLLFTNEKFEEVIPYAERLADYDPENLNLKVKLGILYADVKEYRKAVGVFKDLLKVAPENDKLLYYLGAIYQEVKSYEDAITYFGQIKPESGLYHDSSLQVANMLNTLAQIEFFEEGKNKQTQKRFISFVDDKLKELPKFKVDFRVIKASFYENVEQTELAIAQLDPIKEDESFTSNHLYHLASLHEKAGNHDESLDIMLSIVKIDPKDAHAWNFIGYSLIERGEELDRAFEYITKAMKLRPEDGYIRDSLGWYYYKVGKISESLKELKAAVDLVPDDISIQKHLAIVYSNLKKFGKAKLHLKKAIELARLESEKKELNEFLKSLESNRVPASFLEN